LLLCVWDMILHTPKYANLLDYFYMAHDETVY
jgi:hypothetical protein